MSAGTYATEWKAAIERTRRFGLDPGLECGVSWNSGKLRYLTDERCAEFPTVMLRVLGPLSVADLAAQCLALHLRLRPVVSAWLGCSAHFTLGWIDDGTDHGIFRFDDAFISKSLTAGHHAADINVHAWLTLPSMEIVDASLLTTIALVQGIPERLGSVLLKQADEVVGMTYRPMLVGHEFLIGAGLLQGPRMRDVE